MQTEGGSHPVPAGAERQTEPAPVAEHSAGSEHLPPPSIWPLVTAAGIAMGGMGLVTVGPVSFLGLLIMVIGIVNWIQELRHEPQHH